MGDFPSWVYIVLLGAVAIVYGLLLPKKREAKEPETALSSTVEKVEDTLEHYMTEIEKENEEIIDLVSQIKQESSAKQIALQEQVSEMRQRLMELEQRALNTPPVSTPEESTVVETAVVPPLNTAMLGSQGEALRQSAARMQREQEALQAAEQQEDATDPTQERIQDRYPELFQLHESGKSVDTIARTVGLQRGEVLLILQLAKQEEQS
ncbi:hypothetical protein [Paenibacillus wenxiniae]|uniref:DUF2802 domain-containing protein n=1 Tax=Paenibacillus wenxiniae TaxID=1636843 RepID=A0ABW4RQM3_9BACL